MTNYPMKLVVFKLEEEAHKRIKKESVSIGVPTGTIMYSLLKNTIEDKAKLDDITFEKLNDGKNITLKVTKDFHKKLMCMAIDRDIGVKYFVASILAHEGVKLQ